MFLMYILVTSVVKDKGGLSNAYRSNSPKIGIYVQKKLMKSHDMLTLLY